MTENLKRTKWTTSDEIKFLKGLGGWNGECEYDGSLIRARKIDQKRRLTLLDKYVASMKLRKNWGEIDQEKILRSIL